VNVLSNDMIIQCSRKNIKNSALSSDSFLQNQKSNMINNNNTYNKNAYSYSDKITINSLDVTDDAKTVKKH
jgi:hypothetical protein